VIHVVRVVAVALLGAMAACFGSSAHAQIQPIMCLGEHNPTVECPRDERPPATGREAERNLARARAEQRLPTTRTFDLRNGRFTTISSPTFANGFCSLYIEGRGAALPNRYQHARMDEAACVREAANFARPGVQIPLSDPTLDVVSCDSYLPRPCFEARELLATLVSRAEADEAVRIPWAQRNRTEMIAKAQRISRIRPAFVQLLDPYGFGTVFAWCRSGIRWSSVITVTLSCAPNPPAHRSIFVAPQSTDVSASDICCYKKCMRFRR
jgi:hypothetical protein